MQRGVEPLKGEWSIPGGALEIGETLRQCCAREVREETGLEVEAGEVLDIFDSIHTDPDGRTRYHYVLVDFFCKLVRGELRSGSDAAQARWIGQDELAGYNLREKTEQVIKKGFLLYEKAR